MSKSLAFIVLSAAQTLFLCSSLAQAAQSTGARWEKSNPSKIEWSEYAFNEIQRQGDVLTKTVPRDIGEFCPNYPSLREDEKREFWVYLLSTLSELESSHQPDCAYQESFPDSTGQLVVSRGLLQLSRESANNYGCGFKTASELYDPLRNLSCGIKILGHWVGRHGALAGRGPKGWNGGARYWSVLRTGKKLSRIQAWTNAYCSSRFE